MKSSLMVSLKGVLFICCFGQITSCAKKEKVYNTQIKGTIFSNSTFKAIDKCNIFLVYDNHAYIFRHKDTLFVTQTEVNGKFNLSINNYGQNPSSYRYHIYLSCSGYVKKELEFYCDSIKNKVTDLGDVGLNKK